VALPIASVVAALPIWRVVTDELKTEAVVLVVAITGEAPFKFNAVALLNVTVWLAIVAVPVDAPKFSAVDAPPIFKVVATVLNKFCVVCVPTTVGLPIVNVPLLAPRVIAVAEPPTVIDV